MSEWRMGGMACARPGESKEPCMPYARPGTQYPIGPTPTLPLKYPARPTPTLPLVWLCIAAAAAKAAGKGAPHPP